MNRVDVLMSNVISPHLQKFEKQILSLVPYASNDRLAYLIEKLLPDESAGRQLAVKNEIEKLAKQATKSIDLRSLFTDCQMVKRNKVKHYLDPEGKEFFYKKLKEYHNIYTIGLSMEVYKDAEERAKKNTLFDDQAFSDGVEKSKKFAEFKVDKTEPQPLVSKNKIIQEAKKLNSSCKVFINPIMGMTSVGKKEIGITSSIEKMNNRKVVIQTASEIKANKIYLWLYDHHQEIDFTEELELGFEVIDSQKYSNNKFEYLLQYSSPLTEKQMRVLFGHYLKQKRLATIGPTERFVTPLSDSITSKGYEQLYLNKTHDIPLLCFIKNDVWHAKVAMKTSGNDDLWHFFSDANQEFKLPVLLGHPDIQQALHDRSNVEQYAFILKSIFNKTVCYSLMWYDDYVKDKSVKAIFNQYFKKGHFRVVKISSSNVNSVEDAYVPSALPSHVHPKMAVLNRQPPKAALDIINDCNNMITISDITSLYETIYHGVNDEVLPIDTPLPERYQLSMLESQTELEIVTAENNDERREDRFALSFEMAVTRSNNLATRINGITKNISVQGLLVSLDEETKFRAGEEIEIELSVPFTEKARVLKKQRYLILGYDHEGAVRLLINAIESKHMASKAIRKYIYQHSDDIEASSVLGSRVYGLQKAMRNIYAHNHFSVPFYLKATKHQQYINAASFSGNSDLKHLVYKKENSEDIILNLLSNKKFRESCLSIIAVLAHKKLDARAFYILVLPKVTNDNEEYSFWYRDLSVLKKSSQLQSYTKKMSDLGKPAILKVELKKSNKARNMYFRDEVSFLRGLDKELAHDLEIQLENTIGIGEVTDLTDIAIEMISRSK